MLDLESIPIGDKPSLQESVIKTVKSLKKPDKSIPCFIHLCRLKSLPQILFTQLRFTLFEDISVCQQWCESNCSEYEIRSHKDSTVLLKYKQP